MKMCCDHEFFKVEVDYVSNGSYIERYDYFCTKCEQVFNLFGKNYSIFLSTTQWKKLREEVLLMNDYICQECGEEAKEVHHLNYDNLIDIKQLIPLCRNCHEERHKFMKKENEEWTTIKMK